MKNNRFRAGYDSGLGGQAGTNLCLIRLTYLVERLKFRALKDAIKRLRYILRLGSKAHKAIR
ncbi:hypothetical protein EBX31_14710 [bacterium]|nr:hypothetical protein [bacterium]